MHAGVQVAVDPRGTAGQQLMAAAQVSGIPHAFVVDRGGIVQYSGHPMDPQFEAAVQGVRGQWVQQQIAALRQACMGSYKRACTACLRWWRGRPSSRQSSESCRLSRRAARSSWRCL